MVRRYLKYGGVGFELNTDPSEINKFVRELPEEKRSSLYNVAKELVDHNLITLRNDDFTTIDSEMIPYLKGKRDWKH